jgi:rhodanese-related sulfurtransferase
MRRFVSSSVEDGTVRSVGYSFSLSARSSYRGDISTPMSTRHLTLGLALPSGEDINVTTREYLSSIFGGVKVRPHGASTCTTRVEELLLSENGISDDVKAFPPALPPTRCCTRQKDHLVPLLGKQRGISCRNGGKGRRASAVGLNMGKSKVRGAGGINAWCSSFAQHGPWAMGCGRRHIVSTAWALSEMPTFAHLARLGLAQLTEMRAFGAV